MPPTWYVMKTLLGFADADNNRRILCKNGTHIATFNYSMSTWLPENDAALENLCNYLNSEASHA